MTNYFFAEDLILRLPVGDPERYTLEVETILKDQTFLSAIMVATPQFYNKVVAGKADDKRSIAALRRYYNRFCFRPTPFGLFSSVSPVKWTPPDPASTAADHLNLFVAADSQLNHRLEKQWVQADQVLEPNPTLYAVQHDLRFVRMETDVISGKRRYLLQATDRNATLESLLDFCKTGKPESDILAFICRESGSDEVEAKEYLMFLEDGHILLPVSRAAITGLKRPLTAFPGKEYRGQFNSPVLHQLQEAARRSLNNEPHIKQPLLSVISVREKPPYELHHKLKTTLDGGLWALNRLSLPVNLLTLERFAEQFTARFESRPIPLLEALDPEIGIGYGPPEKEKGNLLLETIHIEPRPALTTKIEWTAVHQFLLDAWHDQQFSAKKIISLDEEGLKQLGQNGGDSRTSGFGILFRASAEQVWIENAGGYHTNSLIGRFTLADPKIKDAAVRMAKREQMLNPNIIFAEILHLSDLHIDNVNRRERILDHEIPVTAASGAHKEMQIALSDLLVTVEAGRVMLRSKHLGMPIIPRLSSAYNHNINELPLFRFLADIPYQYAAPIRTLSLSSMFPGLGHYPRVMFKKAILSPACWTLKAEEFNNTSTDPRSFSAFREQRGIPDRFMLVNGDQQLYFDCRFPAEIDLFFKCIGRNEKVDLQEVFIDEATSIPVCRQFNAFVLPVNPLVMPPLPINFNSNTFNKRRFMPGSEWLYLKIYTSRLGTDTLLNQLAPYLRKQLRNGPIQKWFFVRYEDHAPHVRVRLMVSTSELGKILVDLRYLFEHQFEPNMIREYQVDSYVRELERYGVKNFEQVEDFFHASSMLVLNYLTGQAALATERYLFALAVTDILAKIAFPDISGRLSYYQRRFQQFKSEFNGEKIHVQLDHKYRTMQREIWGTLENKGYFTGLRLGKRQRDCLKAFKVLIDQSQQDHPDFELLVSSLIHMHLNRIFISDSRMQEMIIFHLLFKHTAKMKALAKQASK